MTIFWLRESVWIHFKHESTSYWASRRRLYMNAIFHEKLHVKMMISKALWSPFYWEYAIRRNSGHCCSAVNVLLQYRRNHLKVHSTASVYALGMGLCSTYLCAWCYLKYLGVPKSSTQGLQIQLGCMTNLLPSGKCQESMWKSKFYSVESRHVSLEKFKSLL